MALSAVRKNEWLQWAAFNRASGVDEPSIRAELGKAGLDSATIDSFLAGLSRDPTFLAACQHARRAKLANALNDALLELESSSFDFAEVPRLSGVTAEEFHHRFYALNRPVILTDVVAGWPACSKWSLQFLREQFGSQSVAYQKGRSATDHRDAFVDHTVRAPFAEFLDEISDVPDGASPPYLIAHDRLLDRPEFAPLIADIRFDERYLSPPGGPGQVFFWLGPKGARTPLHRDLANVFMAQVAGRKRVKMVPSRQLHLVYNEHGYHSEAEFSEVAYEEFPLLRKAFIADIILAPGEFLFIPMGWWHHVEALELTITVTGNNFRLPNQLPPIFD
jgi:hypothetical protein